jgi:ATP-dependent DNA helicase DinG
MDADSSPVRALFGATSELSQALSGFEARPGQVEMAEAVFAALHRDETLFVEAGTGTGKTLAYLLAAGLVQKKVVIATATNALLRQIVDKDAVIASRVLAARGIFPRIAEVKGLGNYLCLRRLGEARLAPGASSDVARIAEWSKSTERGDRSELVWLRDSSAAWADVASSPDTRVGPTCEHYDECFVTRMRREAEAADIIVTNHHLFFADLALRRSGMAFSGALPAYDAVIFDEAHKIEDIATEFFGFSVSSAKLTRLARDAKGTLMAAAVPLADATRATDGLLRAGEQFFAALPRPSGAEERAVLRSDALPKAAKDAYFALDTCLDLLTSLALEKGRDPASERLAGRVDELRAMLARICDGGGAEERSGGVCWIQTSERSVSIGTSPVEIGPTLSRLLFERVPAAVLTSATLTAQKGTFDYVRGRLGAPATSTTLKVESPFDYQARAGLYIADDLPDPREPSYESAAQKRVRELVKISGGGAFVLTTSHRMRAVLARGLEGHVPGELLVQGEMPKEEILRRFREREDNVLVATMGFWEGVDVRGRALRLVILDKIPFAVPTDPLTVFRSARLEAEGKSPFADYALPEAALSLKQGFGRLIRSTTDAGVVAITDPRLAQKGYGKVLLRGLPAARKLANLDDVTAFYAALLVAPAAC